jgi:flavin reductase (DIM6/NTAB) family NADH-FMN oxidoreductase RutF
MKKTKVNIFRPVHPSLAALITSVDAAGKANIITLAEVFNISIRKPVIVGIAIRPATYSHGLISETREYVVNLTTVGILEKVDRCGTVSGRNGTDKFDRFGLSPIPASLVKPPLIDECPVNVECKVIGIQTLGDHDLFLGEVVAVHVDDDKVDANGKIVTEYLDLLGYINGEYWSFGKYLAKHGFSKKGQ